MNYFLYISIFLFLLIPSNSKGQTAEISFIYFSEASAIGLPLEIEFPVIKTGNDTSDIILNKNIRRDILFDTLTTPIDSAFYKMTIGSSALTLISKITYNKNNIISISVACEFCGANCNDYQDAFVYSLSSGNRLFISDIMDSDIFYSEILINDVTEQYRENINRVVKLKESCNDCTEYELDNFEFFIASYKNSMNEFSINSFCLHEDSIEILDECFFNRIDSEMCPQVEFIYSWGQIAKYMKIKY